ncbi:uncharacterized protein RB166_020323 [Leptodactylus fuscus]
MQITRLLLLAILIVFSFQTAYSLNCYYCEDPQCNKQTTQPCPSGYTCLAAKVTVGSNKMQVKSCSPPEMCNMPPAIAPPGSSYSQSCCSTDLCNSAVTTKMSLLTAALLVLVSLYVSRF